MGIVVAVVTVPPVPLNFVGERLVIGDTAVFVTKVNGYMSELTAWAPTSNAFFSSVNAFITEVEGITLFPLSAVIVPTAVLDFSTETIVKGDVGVVVTKINNFMTEIQAWSVINAAAFTRLSLIISEMNTEFNITLPGLVVPAALDFADELLDLDDTDAFILKMSSYASEIEAWAAASNAAFTAMKAVSVDVDVKVSSEPSLREFTEIIRTSNHDFRIIDYNPELDRRYDLYIDGVDSTDSVLYPANTLAVTGLIIDGRELDLRLDYWQDGNRLATTKSVSGVGRTAEPPRLQEFGPALTGTTYTFIVYDSDPVAGRKYGLLINSVSSGPTITFPATDITVTGLPDDGSSLTLELETWDNDNYASRTSVTLIATAFGGTPVRFVSLPSVTAITSLGADIVFSSDVNTAAKTEVRTGGGAWVLKVNETSFLYGAPPGGHVQRVRGLLANTLYDYRVTIIGSNGFELVSSIGSFTTAAATAGDDTAIMRGFMTGSRHHGWRVNHNYLHRSRYVAIRFTQEETGNITRVSKHNRQGSGYHEGNGGNYHVKIHPSLNGLPDESVTLGQSNTATDFILTSGPSTGSDRLWIDIDNPAAPVVAGTEYWMVWNSRMTAGNGRSVFNSSEVGRYYESVPGITDRGPYPGPLDMTLYDRTDTANPWESLRPYLIPWVCWEMSSGRIRGNTMYCYYGQNLDGSETMAASRTIEGGQVARQRFTASRNETLDGMWLFWGHTYKNTVDGSPLTIRIKNSSGTILATGSIAAIPALNTLAIQGNASTSSDRLERRTTKTWGYTNLSADFTTVAGQVYDIEFSSGANGGYALTAIFPWPKTTYTGSRYNDGIYERTQMWANSRASIISEGQWTPGAPYHDDARELPIKMVVKGQPRAMY